MRAVRGMRVPEGLAPGMYYRATVQRQYGVPPRMTEVLAGWVCSFEPLAAEHGARDAFEGATHVLVGRWTEPPLRGGDQITSLRYRDGREMVQDGKPLLVRGRRRHRDPEGRDQQAVYVLEEI